MNRRSKQARLLTGGLIGALPVTTPGDEYWDDVTLLLNGEDATIADVSTYSSNFSPSGITQSTSDKKYGEGSLSFDGEDDNATFTMPELDGDYTIEFWYNRKSLSDDHIVLDMRTTSYTGYPIIATDDDGPTNDAFRFWHDGSFRINTTTAPVVGTWMHVAVVRSSGVTRMFINGTQEGAEYNNNSTFNSDTSTLGRRYTGTTTFPTDAYIDDFRITKGVARYTSNFTPPTASLPTNAPIFGRRGVGTYDAGDEYWDDVTLLLDGSSPTNNLKSGAATVSNPNSDVSTTTTDPGSHPYATDFLSFNSDAANKLTITNDTNVAFGNNDFTIEMWIYLASGEIGNEPGLFDGRGSAGTAPLLYINSSGKVVFNRTGSNITGTTTLSEETWYHVALTVNNNIVKIFLNGSQEGSSWDSTGYSMTPTADFQIGYKAWSGSSIQRFHGHMTDLRITKGVARYIQNFTPPTESFPTVLAGTPEATATLRTRGYVGAAPAAGGGMLTLYDRYVDTLA